MGRPPHKNRPLVESELQNLSKTVEEIAEENGMSVRLVYLVGEQMDLDMNLRLKLVRMIKKRAELQKEILELKKVFSDNSHIP
jgi:hypothetical protein